MSEISGKGVECNRREVRDLDDWNGGRERASSGIWRGFRWNSGRGIAWGAMGGGKLSEEFRKGVNSTGVNSRWASRRMNSRRVNCTLGELGEG